MSEYKKVIFFNLSNLYEKKIRKGSSLIIFLFILFYSSMTFADDNITWLNDTLSTNLACILRDDIRDRIYLADTGNSQLVVIDSNSLKVILRLTLDSTFRDLSISKDNSTMAIAGGTVYLVNLESFEVKKMHTDLDVQSVAFDHNDDLMMVSPYSSSYIYHFDPDTETVINSFGVGNDLNISINRGLIKTSKDGNILYVADRTYVYDRLYKIDISENTPALLAKNDSEDNGGTLIDFVVSPKYNKLYVASGYPYDPYGIQVRDGNSLDYIQLLEIEETGLNAPVGVATDLEGKYLYSIPGWAHNNVLYQFDADQNKLFIKYELLQEIKDGESQVRGIAIDRSGKRAFIIHGDRGEHDKVQVVELHSPMSITMPVNYKEGDNIINGAGVITVLKAPLEDTTIFLESDDTTEVQVPASVILPAGQTSVAFDMTIIDDDLLDGTQSASISASILNVSSTVKMLYVNDNEKAILNVILPETVNEGDGILVEQGLVTVSSPVNSDVIVQLASNDETEISVPYSVIIKEGHNSTTFSFTVNENLLIDGIQTSTITAKVEGWTTGSDTINVNDNDTFLMIDIIPYAKEGDGILTGAGKVSIIDAIDYNLVVDILSSGLSEAVASKTVILAGETSASFNLTIKDDNIKDGTQLLTVTATAAGFVSDTSSISILDNENESKLPSWTMYQYNPSNTGYIPIALASYFSERWVKKLDSFPLNPVTAAGGRVFVSTGPYRQSYLMALMVENGEMVWKKIYDHFYYVNPPSYNNGFVYIQTIYNNLETRLRAYNAATGMMLFESHHTAQWGKYYAPTIYNDKVYIGGGQDGGVYSFDGRNGEELWYNNLSYGTDTLSDFEWTPAVNEKYVFAAYATRVGNTMAGLDVIDRQTGDYEFWIPDSNFYTRVSDLNFAPVIGDKDDIIVIQNGRLICFDLLEKDIKYEINENFSGQASVANGKIYAISSGTLSVRNESDGSLLWFWSPPVGSLTKNIIVTDSHIFTSTDNVTYVIDKNTKTIVWSYPAGGHLALSEGALYIATSTGTLISINVFEDIDSDMDGIDDVVEALHCTNPNDADTDDDGILDGIEDKNHNGVVDSGETNPCDNDSDHDGLLDGVEDANHNGCVDVGETNPLNSDTDNDGMPDGWEVQYDLDPLYNDAKEDEDGDHFSNIKEYQENTIPNDNKSHPPRALPWLPLLLGDS